MSAFGPFISLISGTLSVMAGALQLFNPNAGKNRSDGIVPPVVSCPLRFPAVKPNRNPSVHRQFNYYFSLVLNLLGLILGTLMLVNPWLSWVSIRYIIGFIWCCWGDRLHCIAISQIGSGR